MHEMPYVAATSVLNVHVNNNSTFGLTKQDYTKALSLSH